jgi:hypothetical protein
LSFSSAGTELEVVKREHPAIEKREIKKAAIQTRRSVFEIFKRPPSVHEIFRI